MLCNYMYNFYSIYYLIMCIIFYPICYLDKYLKTDCDSIRALDEFVVTKLDFSSSVKGSEDNN